MYFKIKGESIRNTFHIRPYNLLWRTSCEFHVISFSVISLPLKQTILLRFSWKLKGNMRGSCYLFFRYKVAFKTDNFVAILLAIVWKTVPLYKS